MKNILIAEFKHETNGFTKEPTTMEDYKNRNLVLGDEILDYFGNVRNEIGGFISFLRDKEDVTLLPAIAANATPGGKVNRDVFELVRDTILETYRKADHVDGMLLSLHGAMAPDPSVSQDGEGSLLEAIRQVTGRALPIYITLDLHANVTDKMAQYADAIFLFDQYPHTDTYDRGVEAAENLYRFLHNEIKPVMAVQKIPILCPCIPTGVEPAKTVTEKAHDYEKLPGVLSVSVAYSFFYADIEEMGMAVVAVTDNQPELADQIVKEFARFIWDIREQFNLSTISVEEGVKMALAEPEGPVVLADGADNPGGGSPGDSTFVLRALLEHGAKNVAVATIYDPQVVEQAIAAGVGSTISIQLGGKEYPEMMGKPIACDAYVRMICDGVFVNKGPMAHGLVNYLKPTVVLVVDGIEIIVTQTRYQPWDTNIFNAHGIDPTEKKILLVKSVAHYRAHYGQIAKKMINVDHPGLTATSPKEFTYTHLVRPVYPFDDNFFALK